MSGTRITFADDRDSWDRQPQEPERAYGYFEEFRQLGRARDLKKLAPKVAKTHSYLKKISSKYRWTERVTAFDRHMDAQWQAALFEHGRRMVQEHLKTGRSLLSKAQEALATIDPAEMSPLDLVRFMDLYSKMTRVALGEPENSVAVTGAGGGPVQITAVPGDETSREAQMRAATLELGRRLGVQGVELDAEAVLELPE